MLVSISFLTSMSDMIVFRIDWISFWVSSVLVASVSVLIAFVSQQKKLILKDQYTDVADFA